MKEASLPQLMYPLFPMANPQALVRAGPVQFVIGVHVSARVSYSISKSEAVEFTEPLQMYPSPPMAKPIASLIPCVPMFAFCVHVLLCGSNCQKSYIALASYPEPIYPLFPMLKPMALLRGKPGTSARCSHESATGSYSQKSLNMVALPS